jgi:7-cyano-7-deazaguanine synthase in queuosine biosynthesis
MRDPTVEKCELCGSDDYLYGHHTSYYPEAQLWVCGSCHAKIHNTDGFYDLLDPEIERPDSFKHGSPTGLCHECAFKLRLCNVGLDELGVSLSECYHPSEECASCGDEVKKIKALSEELLNWYQENT